MTAALDTPPIRHRLPNRRVGEVRVIAFAHDDHAQPRRLYITANYDPTDAAAPRVLEVFLRGKSKVGTESDFLYDDIAVLLSTSLQYGLTPRGIRNHLGAADSDGRAKSLIAAVVDELIVIQDELVDAWRASLGLPLLHPQPEAAP